MLDFGRETCNDRDAATRREWLITNGIGGYGAGTISSISTRRYHGLLIAATQPPVGRMLYLTRCDETLTYAGGSAALFTNQWASGFIEPPGYTMIERFYLDGTTPTWWYSLGDVLLEKQVWMEQGANTTYIRYRLLRGTEPANLTVKAVVNYRDHHITTRVRTWQMAIEPVEHGLTIDAGREGVPLSIRAENQSFTPMHDWYRNSYLAVEDYRGLDVLDDNLGAGEMTVTLKAGDAVTVVASLDPDADLDGDAAYDRQKKHEAALIEQAGAENWPPRVRQLVLAADQFVVQRSVEGEDGRSVIAGYPWFGDWGRDTMIALPGLTLTTGRYDVAAWILRTFGRFVSEGMLPNLFPDAGSEPEYNTVDATLWYFEALRAYVERGMDDTELIKDLYPTLVAIIEAHVRGTRYGIGVDEKDGLLRAGTEGTQLTWMDVKIGDWVVTPRTGKAVEINALWYNALLSMAAFAQMIGESPDAYRVMADRVKAGFSRFWNEESGFCYDVIDGPFGDDVSLRPNQIFAVSLPHSPLTPVQQKAVVDVCTRHLLTPHGLRSLSPDHPAYVPHYGGNRQMRDGTYHQGTVWGWLIGPYAVAYSHVYGAQEAVKFLLEPLLRHLDGGCAGSVSEIFDGDAPYTPRGAFAQAWSVAEVLRAWHLLEQDAPA